MRNQKAERLVAAGLVLHIIQWIFILWAFLKVKHLFSDYTIYNPNVISGSMQSLSFIQMMRAMMYSGAIVNYVLFFALVLLIYGIVLHAILIVLEMAAYVMIRRNPSSSWGFFFIAAGVKLACHLEYNRHSFSSCRLSADETEKSRKRRQGRKKAETALAYPKTRAASKQNPEKTISSG